MMSLSPIGCDVPPTFPSPGVLPPYLHDVWRDNVARSGMQELATIIYPPPNPLTSQADWRDTTTAEAGTTPVALAAQALGQAFRQLVVRAKLPGLVWAVVLALILHVSAAFGQPIQQRDVQHDVSVLFNRAMKVATGGGGHVALGEKVDFDVPPGMVFVPREASDALLTAAGRKPPPNYVGIVLNEAAVGWFVIIRVVNEGHVDADAMASWTADDVIASARDEQAADNQERDRQGLPPLEVRRWVTRPEYDPLLHRLIWCPLLLPLDARRDAGGEIVQYAAQFGRNGYVRLAMTTVLDLLPSQSGILGVIMNHIAYAPGATYADFMPNRDPVDPAGLAGVFGYEHLRKANLTTRLRAFGEPLIAPAEILAVIVMAGAILLVVYRWWRLQRPVR